MNSIKRMLSYHNDPALKQRTIEHFAAHMKADEVVQGIGFEDGRGCAIGCMFDKYDHSQMPVVLGMPEWLACLVDGIFEGLPEDEAPQFAADFLAATPVGKDVEEVRWQLAILRHERQLVALVENKAPYAEQCRVAIQGVIDWIKSGHLKSAAEARSESAVLAAESARLARSEEWSESESAVLSAAWSTAESEWSAKWSARSAARSAEWAAAELAEWAEWTESAAELARSEAHYQWERDTLLSLLRDA